MNLLNYQTAFVCYFDVLGFRSFIKNKDRVEGYFSFIVDALNKVVGELKLGSDIKYHLISDAVVLSISVEGQNKIDCLRELLGRVAIMQYYLAVNDIWIRGAVTFGEIGFSTDEKIISGVALAEAYELEKLALYPRVIIDPRICAELNLTKADLVKQINVPSPGLGGGWIYDEEKSSYIPNMLPMKDYLFINFMTMATRQQDAVKDEIEKIYQNLRNNLYSLPPQIQKYQWLRDYIYSSQEIEHLTQNFQHI